MPQAKNLLIAQLGGRLADLKKLHTWIIAYLYNRLLLRCMFRKRFTVNFLT